MKESNLLISNHMWHFVALYETILPLRLKTFLKGYSNKIGGAKIFWQVTIPELSN